MKNVRTNFLTHVYGVRVIDGVKNEVVRNLLGVKKNFVERE